MKLYMVAGEASGDARGAELMRALQKSRSDFEFHGAGGREMAALAGGSFLDWADEAVVGLWDVLKKLQYFRAEFHRMLEEIARLEPVALILIDYPGFNSRLAKAARKHLPETKIIYYISPQIWAWNRGRIPKMARYLDLMLCIFPFEKALYEGSGLKAIFVGHPMLDSLSAKRTGAEREPDLIGLFPGSREKEVRKIFPVMLEAARTLQAKPFQNGRASWRFEAAAASGAMAGLMRNLAGADAAWCRITVGESHSLMQRAFAGMVASGTATLEAAFFGMPLTIIYKVAWLTWIVGKRLVKVDFLGMPNILSGREIAREFLQDAAEPRAIAAEMHRLLTNCTARRQMECDLAAVRDALGQPGAGTRAAIAINAELGLATS